MRKIVNDNKGSFTIEAAVIISFLTFVITGLLFLSFFLYDRCVVERTAAMAALRGSEAVWEKNPIRYQKADEAVSEILTGQLLGADSIEKSVKASGSQVTVSLSMKFKWWDFKAEAEKKAVNPVLFIRNCRKGLNLVQKGKKDEE